MVIQSDGYDCMRRVDRHVKGNSPYLIIYLHNSVEFSNNMDTLKGIIHIFQPTKYF